MKRLLPFSAALAGAASLALWAAPAAAQDEAGDKVTVLDVFGEDPCPASTGNEIVVCRRLDEEERYRIPEALRGSSSPANESWARRVESYEAVGDFGPLSCSPIGIGGELGCTAQMIAAAYEEKRNAPSVRAGELIAQARTERLATIDAEAAETQARVEELERQYMERVQREDSGEAAPPTAASGTPVVVSPADITP
jgi:hypothetical protein